jgi:hypothetical protein
MILKYIIIQKRVFFTNPLMYISETWESESLEKLILEPVLLIPLELIIILY